MFFGIIECFSIVRFWDHEIFDSHEVVLNKIYLILSDPSPSLFEADLSHKGRGDRSFYFMADKE